MVEKKWLSTGAAAKICSVTPNTVLKWIYSGKLPARRTAGGHYRIFEKDLRSLEENGEQNISEKGANVPYCWEFNANEGRIKDTCFDCVVYKGRALRCYEIRPLGKEQEENYCAQSCENCEYFLSVADKPLLRLLVITDNFDLTVAITDLLDPDAYSVRFCRCDYECTATIYRHHPHIILIDMDIQTIDAEEILELLASDTNMSEVKIVLTSKNKTGHKNYMSVSRLLIEEKLIPLLREICPADSELSHVTFSSVGDFEDWEKNKSEKKLKLTEVHWMVINYVKKYYRTTGKSPTIAKIAKKTGLSSKEICRLFPCGLIDGAFKLVGIPSPTGCVPKQ